jgi:hypothetical protein
MTDFPLAHILIARSEPPVIKLAPSLALIMHVAFNA